jgi:cell division protein FtsL
MALNRKNQSAAIRFGPAMKAFLLCLFIGGSGIGYVWQKNQIYELGQQIKKRELRLAELRDQNEKLKKQLAVLRTPASLEARARELNLGLGPPNPSQIWRLVEPQPDSPKSERERQYAAQQVAAKVGPGTE